MARKYTERDIVTKDAKIMFAVTVLGVHVTWVVLIGTLAANAHPVGAALAGLALAAYVNAEAGNLRDRVCSNCGEVDDGPEE